MSQTNEPYSPQHHIRAVTATSLFDGHDAAINIIRRILQNTGVEVIHLGHNRSVNEVVAAAIDEDAQGIAVSSYQGGHLEYFKYMVDLLKERGASHIKVFGGGGGVIIPEEIKELEAYGVTKIYSPEDGNKWGLQGIINHMVELLDFSTVKESDLALDRLDPENKVLVGRLITAVELAGAGEADDLKTLVPQLKKIVSTRKIPVVGITGTGGAGKSSLTDELILRLLRDFPDIHLAVVSCDPSRRKTGGALLGDRIRMNAISSPRVYMRSLATRRSQTEIPDALPEVIQVLKAAAFDLILVETAGIGQGDSSIIDLVDLSVYVMTSEFGAPSQLEKIDMLDFADMVVVNKYEKRGGEDAVRDVRKQVQRNRQVFEADINEMPVYGTIASKFNDDGVTAFYQALLKSVGEKTGVELNSSLPEFSNKTSTSKAIIVPPERIRYLAEISDAVRDYHAQTEEQAAAIRKVWHFEEVLRGLEGGSSDDPSELMQLKQAVNKSEALMADQSRQVLKEWEDVLDVLPLPEHLTALFGDERFRFSHNPLKLRQQLGSIVAGVFSLQTTEHFLIMPEITDGGSLLFRVLVIVADGI